VYVAAGYNGNGMTFGTFAGNILTSLIHQGDHTDKKLFDA